MTPLGIQQRSWAALPKWVVPVNPTVTPEAKTPLTWCGWRETIPISGGLLGRDEASTVLEAGIRTSDGAKKA
jgi:hypothetical protein